MKSPKYWKPWFIENSRFPIWLSKLAPIEINAITLGPWVISRSTLSEKTKRHETIHYQQYLELGFIGFWIIYVWDYFIGLARHGDGRLAYYNIRFEQEAYKYDTDEDYLEVRKRYKWWSMKEDKNGDDQTNRV